MTVFVQCPKPETRAVPIIGNKREWNIVTETGGRLERFEGTKRAADARAVELHKQRFPDNQTENKS